jgi:hypothetical protein
MATTSEPDERVMMRAALTEQIVVELAREAVDAYILDQSVGLPARLWQAIESDDDMSLTDIALAAIDLFGFLIDTIAHRRGLEEAAAMLEAVAKEHQQSIAALAQRMSGTIR